MDNQLPSEQVAIVGTNDLTHHGHSGTGTDLTEAIDMSEFHHMLGLLFLHELANNTTLDVKLVQATTEDGTYKDISGKALTQLTQVGGDEHIQAMINLRAEELDVTNGYRFVKMEMYHEGSGNSYFHGVVMGFHPRWKPATDLNLDSVVEIVN